MSMQSDALPATVTFLPFRYASKCKRNKQNGLPFVLDNVLDDLLILLLAFVPFSAHPLLTGLAIAAFHTSLWIIYEAGYVENDRISARAEKQVKVAANFHAMSDAYSEKAAWIWAAVVGYLGACLTALIWSGETSFDIETSLWIAAVWAVVLIALRATYVLYNRVDKMTRVMLYLPLQLIKYGFPALFVALPAAGAAAIGAQISRRWMPYIIYRFSNKKPEKFPARLIRLVTFVSLWVLLLPSAPLVQHLLLGALIGGWLLVRSATQIRLFVSNAQPVSKDSWVHRK